MPVESAAKSCSPGILGVTHFAKHSTWLQGGECRHTLTAYTARDQRELYAAAQVRCRSRIPLYRSIPPLYQNTPLPCLLRIHFDAHQCDPRAACCRTRESQKCGSCVH